MEKISGIVKASPRLTSVDMKEASPVRPGTPGFGRPQGVSSLALKEQLSSFGSAAEKGAGVHAEMMDWRSKDGQRAAIAAELSDKFFIKNRIEPGITVDPGSAPINRSGAAVSADGFDGVPEMFETSELRQPEGLYPKGSFIDRTA